ncbi:phage virion morphogenesis protein [Polaribacter undariae]|uniref:Phage virion morphogenesis protein n=1 Tax=Polaribacter sejongensis TaxID=985043 RepID=A0AAJ1R0R4_9FLAO|nr:phage virion morphogenesis protein [Polaribacter undariae]MDN3621333.1 phage virion morphogenesis protein [Polaribacter undariae]UWD31875.1 phage virion morphogenesis protein [Polaribacter undariae]
MNDNSKKFDKFIADYAVLKRKLPRMYGIEAVNLFKENFDKEGFIVGNGSVIKWKKTRRNTGRKVLKKSGRLQRGIHIKRIGNGRVVVGVDSNIKYAALHNFGGTIPITPKMRRYFWAMFKQTGDAYFKGMALTKKKEFVIPERKYIGKTSAMEPRLDRRTIKELKKITQKYT